MAELFIDSGVTKNPNDQRRVDGVMKAEKKRLTEHLGKEYPITQKLITHGQPSIGVQLRGEHFVIRTTATIPDEDVEAIRFKLGGKNL